MASGQRRRSRLAARYIIAMSRAEGWSGCRIGRLCGRRAGSSETRVSKWISSSTAFSMSSDAIAVARSVADLAGLAIFGVCRRSTSCAGRTCTTPGGSVAISSGNDAGPTTDLRRVLPAGRTFGPKGPSSLHPSRRARPIASIIWVVATPCVRHLRWRDHVDDPGLRRRSECSARSFVRDAPCSGVCRNGRSGARGAR